MEITPELASCLSDRTWRLNNLYSIINKSGEKVQFKMNWAQSDFMQNLHYFNVVLKARQLGFSTFILLYILDACLFNENQSAGVIAQSLNAASDLFTNKVKFAYDNLPDWLKEAVKLEGDNARMLRFSNGSSIVVGTSLRGGTHQYLHVSEYGKIAARYPDKAKEIKTGAFNTVQAGQVIFVESTAEGAMGEFYDLVMYGKRLEEEGAELSPLEPKLHFYPWYKNEEYTEKVTGLPRYTNEVVKVFEKYPFLSEEQKVWYSKKYEIMTDLMKQEFPGSIEEAFEKVLEGAYYATQMTMVRKNGQITELPYNPRYKVDTFWDLGLKDNMCIWFYQNIGGKHCFIDYYENSGEGLGHYAAVLERKGYMYGKHYWPHDGGNRKIGERLVAPKEDAESLGIRPVKIVAKTTNVIRDIQKVRLTLPLCWFDAVKTKVGVLHLDNYRKEWDEKLGTWRDSPYHDAASNGADAFRIFVTGYNPESETPKTITYAEMEYDVFSV